MTPIEKEIEGIVDGILEDYRHGRDIDKLDPFQHPDKAVVIDMIGKLLRIVYPGASRDKAYRIYNTKHNLSMLIEDVMYNLNKQIAIALRVDRTEQEAQEKAQELSLQFFRAIPGIRAIAQTDVEDLAENAGVPVWNGLTTEWHPTQMLADILTVQENFNYDIKGKTLVFMGDAANNVARSLMVVCSKLGMNFVACGPKENMPDAELVKTCEAIAAENGCTVKCTDDVKDACTGADVIYTDVWVSMGEPDEVWAERIKHLEKFRVTKEVMAMANPDAIFLHCLPAFHDTNTTIGADIAERFGVTEMEVEDEVFESKASKVFDEAENRMHTIKAVMYATLQ